MTGEVRPTPRTSSVRVNARHDFTRILNAEHDRSPMFGRETALALILKALVNAAQDRPGDVLRALVLGAGDAVAEADVLAAAGGAR